MQKNLICVSKKLFFFFLFGFIILIAIYSNYVLSNNKSTIKTQAKELEITGGTDAEEGEFPFNVALFEEGNFLFRNDGRLTYEFDPFCTGVAIDRQWVLTAAHCVSCIESSKLAIGLVKRKGEMSISKY